MAAVYEIGDANMMKNHRLVSRSETIHRALFRPSMSLRLEIHSDD